MSLKAPEPSKLPGATTPLTSAQLPEAFAAAGPVIFTDVFDTLVHRLVRPEHSKIIACERLAQMAGLPISVGGAELYTLRQKIERDLGRKTIARIREAEFRLADMARDLHAALKAAEQMRPGLAVEAFVDLAFRAECVAERQVLRAKPGAVAALEAAKAAGHRVIIVSDFYLPGSVLGPLLADVGIPQHLYEAMHVSCDREASKRSGRMYDLLLGELALNSADVTMFGDNAHSDIAMACARGIRTVQVDDADRVAFYQTKQAEVDTDTALRAAIAAQVSAPDVPANHARQTVPALLLFAERLYRTARAKGLSHLFFLAREGQMMRRLFDLYQESIGVCGADRITTHYVLASRRSTFIASLAPLAEETFDSIFRQYRRISLRDFVRSCGLPDSLSDTVASEMSAEPDAVQDDFPTSAVFSALKANGRFAAAYEARRIEQREALRRYLDGFGVDLTTHPLALVDCGWKGSIQDFIRKALPPSIEVCGYYLGLLAVGQSLDNKTGLLFSNKRGLTPDFATYVENTSLFEVLLCADHGTTLDYTPRPDGSVVANLLDDPDERAFIDTHSMPVAVDTVRAYTELLPLRARTVLPQHRFGDIAAESHGELVFKPWTPSARWIFSATHRESFGQFNISKVGVQTVPTLSERIAFFARVLRAPRRTLGSTFWPALAIFAHGGKLAVCAYAFMRRNRRAKSGNDQP